MTTVGTRPRGAAALLATPPRALAMTIVAGAAISLQSYLNGRLGGDIGSPTVAAAVNNLVATVATLGIVLATGALPRAVARLRALRRPPLWHFLGGLSGAALVLVSAAAAPEVGVALLTVAIVCGSTGGRLPLHAAANGPLARETGEPFVASLVNTTLGFAALALVALVTLATTSLDAL